MKILPRSLRHNLPDIRQSKTRPRGGKSKVARRKRSGDTGLGLGLSGEAATSALLRDNFGIAHVPQSLAGFGTRVFAIFKDCETVYENVGNTDSVVMRIVESSRIADFGGIEDHDVGPISFAKLAATFEMKCICGQAGHFADCI